jgi:hypothetical protein
MIKQNFLYKFYLQSTFLCGSYDRRLSMTIYINYIYPKAKKRIRELEKKTNMFIFDCQILSNLLFFYTNHQKNAINNSGMKKFDMSNILNRKSLIL